MIGLLLLAWLFGYVRRADWHDGPVKVLITVYFFVAQVFALGLIVWLGVRFNKEHKQSLPDRKRKAFLERRGLVDFISPFAVVLAVLLYFLFAAFVFYIRQHPFPGFAGLISLVGVTLIYAAFQWACSSRSPSQQPRLAAKCRNRSGDTDVISPSKTYSLMRVHVCGSQ